MMEMKLNDDGMRALMAKAILDSITPENRETMLTNAVAQFINKPDGNKYGSGKTPLEEAFDYAARDVARKAIAEKFESDTDFKGRVDSTVNEAIERAFTGENKKKMLDNMVAAVCAAFRVPDRY